MNLQSVLEKIKNTAYKNKQSCILIFFILIYALGVFCSFDYGVSYDYESESYILFTNVKYMGETVLGKGSLDDKQFFRGLPNLETYKERDHGKAMYYPFALFRILIHPGSQTTQHIMHLYTFTINFIGLLFLYKIAVLLFGRKLYGISASLLWLASPRMFADSFYNEKDMVFASLVIISIYFSLRIIERPNFKTAIFLGIVTAFACNTRILGLAFPGLALLLYCVKITRRKQWNKKNFLIPLLSLATYASVFILITPAAWSGIVDYFVYTLRFSADFSRWNGSVLYWGQLYNHTTAPLPWHYLPVMMVITTPLLITAFILFGEYIAIKNRHSKNTAYLLLLNIFILLPIIFVIIKGSNIYNGWRHFYFLYAPMLLIAISGVKFLAEHNNKKIRAAVCSLIAVQIFSSCLWGMVNHPYEYTYFNIIARKSAAQFDLDYWNVSSSDCLLACVQKNGDDFSISSSDIHSENALNNAVTMLPDNLRKKVTVIDRMNREDAGYILINPTYYYIESKTNPDFVPLDMQDYVLYSEITVDGNTIMAIYQKTTEA